MFFEPSYSPLNTPLAPSFGVMFGVYIYLAPRFAHGMSKSIHTLPFSSGILLFQKGAKPPRKTTRWSLKRPTGEDGGESNPRKANATPAWVGFSSRKPIFFFFFLGGVWDPFMTNQDQHSVTNFHFDQHPGCLQMCAGRKQATWSGQRSNAGIEPRSWRRAPFLKCEAPFFKVGPPPPRRFFVVVVVFLSRSLKKTDPSQLQRGFPKYGTHTC